MQTTLTLVFLLAVMGCQQGPQSQISSATSNAISNVRYERSISVGSIAVGDQVLSEMQVALSEAGLTDQQTQIIIESARVSLHVTIGNLNVPGSLRLAEEETDPIEYSSPAIVEGAIKSLGDGTLALGTAAKRSEIAKVIMASNFASLNGRTATLSKKSVLALTKNMVGSAVGQLKNADLGGKNSGVGMQALMSSSVGSLAKAGISETDSLEMAKGMVASAIAKIPMSKEEQKYLPDAINKATYGAVSVINQVHSAKDGGVEAVSTLTAASVSGLKELKVDETQVASTVKQICSGAVAALGEAKLTGTKLGPALQSITHSSLLALSTNGFTAKVVKESAGAVAGGAVAALALAGVSEKDIAKTDIVSKIMTGTITSLTSAGVSGSDVASTMSSIVGQTVASLGQAGLSNTQMKMEVMNNVIAGAMSNFKASGITSAATLTVAMQGLGSGASAALGNAGIASTQISTVVSYIAQSSISHIASTGAASDTVKNIISNVTQGVVQGMNSLVTAGTIKAQDFRSNVSYVTAGALTGVNALQNQNMVSSSDLGTLSGAIAGAALDGMTFSGAKLADIQTIQSQVNTMMTNTLTNFGITGSALTTITNTISTATTNSLTTASAVTAGSIEPCSEDFPDSLTDTAFITALNGKETWVCAAPPTNICPRPRAMGTTSYSWFPQLQPGTNSMCQLQIFKPQSTPSAGTTNTTTTPTMLAAPAFSPLPSNYSDSVTVMLLAAPADAIIRYTLDGSIPTISTGLIYTTPIQINESKTINAFAYKDGYTPSSMVSGSYTIVSGGGGSTPVIAPYMSPPAGTYIGNKLITLSTSTPGASIRYTLDGTTPTPYSGFLYGTSFLLSSTTTIKAIAYTSSTDSSTAVQSFYNIVPLFNNYGTFSTGNSPYGLAAADLNGDDFNDLIIGVYDGIRILFGNGDGTFDAEQSFVVMNGLESRLLQTGDLNHDGKIDIVVGGFGVNKIMVFLNNTTIGSNTMSFIPGSDPLYITADSNPRSVALGDIDGDNNTDIVVAIANGNWNSVFFGYGDGTFMAPVSSAKPGMTQYPTYTILADMDNNGKIDILSTIYNSSFGINLNSTADKNSPNFATQASFIADGQAAERPNTIAVGNFDNMGGLDVVVDNYMDGQVSVLLNYSTPGTLNFSPRFAYSTGGNTEAVAVGDVNKDGKTDIVTANANGTISILLGNGDGTFQPSTNISGGTGSFNLILTDLNNDGSLEVITTNNSSSSYTIFMNNMP